VQGARRRRTKALDSGFRRNDGKQLLTDKHTGTQEKEIRLKKENA
jgi:hypothetical protein